MACVSITTMSVLWEGANGASFNPSRGVRQGDPLSPYLFVLCMEWLGHLIQQECERGRWKPLKFRNNGPSISHLFFADNLLLFAEASIKQMCILKEVMTRFCGVSGYRINLEMSKAFFSRNVNFNRALKLSEKLGVGLTGNLGST